VSLTSRDVASRVGRLADTLATLRIRVREAVAGETGRAVGEAVRDLLAAALEGGLGSSRYQSPSQKWDDDRDPWREDEDVRYVPTSPARWTDAEEKPTVKEQRAKRAARWSAALAFASTVVRCWAARRIPAWVVIVIGTLAGVAAGTGGHLAHSGLALLAAVGDLFPPSEPTNWGINFF